MKNLHQFISLRDEELFTVNGGGPLSGLFAALGIAVGPGGALTNLFDGIGGGISGLSDGLGGSLTSLSDGIGGGIINLTGGL
jgi:hypothetical protein